MKHLTRIMLACMVLALTLAAGLRAQDLKYVGTSVCKMCHNSEKIGKQYDIWSKQKHAQAYKALQTDAANEIAKKKGSDKPAAETAECLGCHVTGGMKDPAMYDTKFAKEDGVGCESCHGPGSKFKSMHMKPEGLEAAKAAGMRLPKIADGSAEKQCRECHNEKSPTFKSFDLAAMWDKIKHPRPAK